MGIGFGAETGGSFYEMYYDSTETIIGGTNPIEELTDSATTKVCFGYAAEGTNPASLRALVEVWLEFDEFDEFWTDEINATETT